jgi:hypothetical protein
VTRQPSEERKSTEMKQKTQLRMWKFNARKREGNISLILDMQIRLKKIKRDKHETKRKWKIIISLIVNTLLYHFRNNR